MIELIFVIVVLGILAGVAMPRLAATRTDAEITKGRNDIAAIRSSIITRRSQDMMSGNGANYPTNLTTGAADELFNEVLNYPIHAKANTNGAWSVANAANKTYNYRTANENITFTYSDTNGTFDCDHTNAKCKSLTE